MLGLTMSCNAFLTSNEVFNKSYFTWTQVENYIGTPAFNDWKLMGETDTLLCPAQGVYTFTMWAKFDHLQTLIIPFVTIGTKVVRGNGSREYYNHENAHHPVIFNGTFYIEEKAELKFGIICETPEHTLGISPANKVHLQLFKHS